MKNPLRTYNNHLAFNNTILMGTITIAIMVYLIITPWRCIKDRNYKKQNYHRFTKSNLHLVLHCMDTRHSRIYSNKMVASKREGIVKLYFVHFVLFLGQSLSLDESNIRSDLSQMK